MREQNYGELVIHVEGDNCRYVTLVPPYGYALVGKPVIYARVWDKNQTYIVPFERLVYVSIPNKEKERNNG
jgi:hypothetical protein